MDTKAKELAVQVHLGEFSALRSEMLELIKWRETLIFYSLAISGALFSFAFSSSVNNPEGLSPRLALYLVAPLASVIGGLWMSSTWRIRRIGLYVRDVIAPGLNAILKSFDSESQRSSMTKVFDWQLSSQRIFREWPRFLFEWMVLSTSFVLSGATAQLILLRGINGNPLDRVKQVEFPWFYVINWVLILITLFALSGGLFETRQRRRDSKNRHK
jgi:hypothetical protein